MSVRTGIIKAHLFNALRNLQQSLSDDVEDRLCG